MIPTRGGPMKHRGWASQLSVARHRSSVVAVCLLLIAGQLVLRAWAVFPSFFYADDYVLLADARDRGASGAAGYYLADFNSNLIPGVRLLAVAVEQAGTLEWTLAASIALALQAAASLAALAMLLSLHGRRWGIVPPLLLYLFSAVTVPSYMWWIAALCQLPLQICFFLGVLTWVAYLRTRSLRWLAACVTLVVVGLAFYTKSALIAPVLAFLAVGYFARGRLLERVRSTVAAYWPALVVFTLLLGGYTAYYRVTVPQPFTDEDGAQMGQVLSSMLGTSLPTSLVGGPWRWWDTTPPVVLAQPPIWAISLSSVALVVLACYGFLRRTRTLRAWAMLAAYAVALAVLLGGSRGQIYGAISGLEFRYLTDVVCAATLALGLVFLPLKGAVESSEERTAPLLLWHAPRWVTVAACVAVTVGGVVSTVGYVGFWHHDNASASFVERLRADVDRLGPVDLVPQTLPDSVMPAYTSPMNQSPDFVDLLDLPVTYPDSSDRIGMIDDDGSVHGMTIGPGPRTAPGPSEGCGWRIGERGRSLRLDGTPGSQIAPNWMRIAYLSSQASVAQVTLDGTTRQESVRPGLNNLYLRAEGDPGTVRIDGLEPGTTLCIDVVEVGPQVLGPAW
ncbi:hypothetical protein [uncultured Nocardioides sp.]|uniref:hypothetical protein n=1 Tax=uncultured Nocardioides sp. TaxID=198441 RepID=UPI0026147F91|nr:hypothetical protein [uncultured Nocardioides sp.]